MGGPGLRTCCGQSQCSVRDRIPARRPRHDDDAVGNKHVEPGESDPQPRNHALRSQPSDPTTSPGTSRTLHQSNQPTLKGQGSFQSTAAAPCFSSSSFARLNGREPKKPLCADSGLGCADSMQGTGSEERLEVPRVAAPEDRDQRPTPRGERSDRLLGDLLPTLALVGVRPAGLQR